MTDLTIERHFNAPPETVFAYVSEATFTTQWWGPETVNVVEHQLDMTSPGPYLAVMQNGEGQRYKVTGVVTSVEPPHSLAFTWGWHDEQDQRGHESAVRFDLRSDGAGGTLFTLTHSGLPDDEARANHNTGWTSSLVKLSKHLN